MVLLGFLLLTGGCSLTEIESDLTDSNLFGKVMSVRVRSFYPIDDNGQISTGDPTSRMNRLTSYNTGGFSTEIISYDRKDNITWSATMEYDEENHLIIENSYMSDGSLNYSNQYTYTEGILTEVNTLDPDMFLLQHSDYIYNKDNQLSEILKYSSDETLLNRVVYEYEKSGGYRIETESTYDSTGTMTFYYKRKFRNEQLVTMDMEIHNEQGDWVTGYVYTYDSGGNVSSCGITNSFSGMEETYVYKTYVYGDFDGNNNWTIKYEFTDGTAEAVYTRELEYYD